MSNRQNAAPAAASASPATRRALAARWAGIALALFLVNLMPSFHNVWPTPWITLRPELSIEAAAIVLLIAIVAQRRTASAWLINGLAVVLMCLALARYLEVTAPALYGRAINLYWDTQHLPAVASMLVDGIAPGWIVAGGIAACGLLVLIYAALRWALRTLASAADERRLLASVAACLIGAYLLAYYASFAPVLRWFSIPVTQTYVRQIEFVAEALAGTSAAANLPAADPLAEWAWSGRPDVDVFVVFVESYGAVAYDAESVADTLEPHRAALAAAAAEIDAGIASAFVTSPTFGGVSWLAHASFMTGIDVTESGTYNLLLTQARETLADRFAAAGYRALALMPGLRGDWPEGSFYGFDRIYGERDIAYTGPAFGWWRVPDQFALARLDDVEIDVAGRKPLFVFFPTISTHMPFRPTPPYQPNWNALTGPEPYAEALLTDAASAAPDLTNLRPAYAGALAYTYDYLCAYVRRLADREFVLLILGDHQPPASVAGEGARWDVPVHVVASDAAMLDAFTDAGFVEGIVPRAEPVARTHELGARLLEALGAARAAQ